MVHRWRTAERSGTSWREERAARCHDIKQPWTRDTAGLYTARPHPFLPSQTTSCTTVREASSVAYRWTMGDSRLYAWHVLARLGMVGAGGYQGSGITAAASHLGGLTLVASTRYISYYRAATLYSTTTRHLATSLYYRISYRSLAAATCINISPRATVRIAVTVHLSLNNARYHSSSALP